MGNLCGKQSKDDNFQGSGRTLASAPAPTTKASIPAHVANQGSAASKPQPKVGGPARTVGGSGGQGSDPKAAAAAAAEVRSQKSQPGVGQLLTGQRDQARANKPVTGDLAKKLEEQKKRTMNQTLQQTAHENRAQREADAANDIRNYN
jgi:hypothetical protein